MRLTTLILIGLLAATPLLWAQDDVLISNEFETTQGPFTTGDELATLDLLQDPDLAFKGQSCLQLTYTQRDLAEGVDGGMPGSIAYNVSPPQPELKGIRFALATEFNTPLVLIASEGDGGPRYQTMVQSQAGSWQDVRLGLQDFALDPQSPPDPDGKLTPGGITGFLLVDLYQMLHGAMSQVPLFHVEPFRDQHVWLDNFDLLAADPRERPAPVEGQVLINDYQLPLTRIFTIGGEQTTASLEDLGEAGHALKLSYTIPAGTIMGVSHALATGALAEVRSLRLRARSEQAETFIVALQEDQPEQAGQEPMEQANYSAMVSLDAGAPYKDIDLPISSFALQQNAVDPDGRLDMSKVNGVMLLDASAMQGAQDHQNTLWLQSLVGLK
jgi:hypothetical protein